MPRHMKCSAGVVCCTSILGVVVLRFNRFAVLFLQAGLLSLFSSSTIFAQSSDFQFERLTTKEGLSDNRVQAIHQDRRGFMWFGTRDGLNRYDGQTFKTYRASPQDSTSLMSNDISSIHEDHSGSLWISALALHKYDRENDRFIRYPPDPRSSKNPQGGVVRVLSDYDRYLWIGSDAGLDKFNPVTGVFERIAIGDLSDVWAMADDESGNLWLGSLNNGKVIRLNKSTLQIERLPGTGGLGSEIHDIFPDRSVVWIAAGGGLFRLDKNANTFLIRRVAITVANTLCRDSLERFWCGTDGKGLRLLDQSTNSLVPLIQNSSWPTSLGSSFVRSIYVDRQGSLWVATSNGVSFLSVWKKKFRHISHKDEDSNSIVDGVVRAIMEQSNGDLWIGTWGGGLSRRDHQTGDIHNYSSPSLAAYLSVLYEDSKGVVWIGTNAMDGIVKWDRNSDSFLKDSLERKFTSKNWAASILEDSYGALWVGTGNGICVFDRKTKTKQWYALERSGSSVSVIFEDHLRKLWISAAGSLYEYDREGDQFVRRQDVRAYSIFEDKKNRLWLGFKGGLVLYDQKIDSLLPVLTESNGLAGGIVFGILGDAHGNLWLSTNKGLTKYNPDSRALRNYGTHDGYPFPQISFGSYHGYYKKRNGEMIFGAGNGYVEFHPDSIRDNPNVPPVVITDFRLFNEPVGIGLNSPLQTNITDATSLSLTYIQNTISFEFAALDFTSPLNNKFAHKLDGFDDKWVDIGNRHFAQYTNLSPGEYMFRVKGSNSDGVWNEEGAFITITIAPPWWKTVWAYGSYGVLFVAGLYSVRRYEKKRDRQKQQAELERVESEKRLQQEFSKQLIETQEAERKRVASELHDSLGQHLLIVNNELQLYKQSNERKDEDIDRTITTVKGAIKEVREIASNLHPHHLEKLGLRAAVEAMIEQISRSTSVKFNVAIEDVDDKLNMQAKINLYRVVQEAIANIVRHSGATKANITIREADNAVQAIIEDDGKGIVQSSSQGGRQGFGLKSMAERMNLVGGTITFDSSVGNGTKIRIIIPC